MLVLRLTRNLFNFQVYAEWFMEETVTVKICWTFTIVFDICYKSIGPYVASLCMDYELKFFRNSLLLMPGQMLPNGSESECATHGTTAPLFGFGFGSSSNPILSLLNLTVIQSGCCGVVGSTLAFRSIGHGFESEHRLLSYYSAPAFSKLRSLA